MNLHQHVEDLNNRILQGDILGAFDRYYADDVVMQDNQGEPRRGKAESRTYEEQFVNGLTDFRGAEVRSVAVHEEGEGTGTAFVEWFMDFTHSAFGDQQREQVAVQQWKDGQIVHERFYYNEAP